MGVHAEMTVAEQTGGSDEVQVIAVTCNKCGAALDVPPRTRFVTCTYCGSRLEVHRTGGAAYTEILESIDERTAEIAGDVDAIRLQNDLERLDREWMIRRESLMVSDKRGGRHVPGRVGSLLAAGFAAVFGVIWTVAAASAGAPGFFTLFGIVFIAFAIFAGIYGSAKASQYQSAEADYHRQRGDLLRKMHDDGMGNSVGNQS